MFAAQITGPSRIEIVDAPEPSLSKSATGAKQIVFQPELTCLCGSDIPFFLRGEEQPAPKLGHSLHEMIGTVVDTNGTRFKPGAQCCVCRGNSLASSSGL